MRKTSARLLSLLSLLQARRDWPASQLAERLQVSDRTVRRDVDRLRELGYPIGTVKGPDGGYRLEAGSELPPLLFDDEQAVALTIALRSATTAGAGIEEAADRALATIRQVMPSRLRHRIDSLQVTAVERSAAHRVPSEVLMTLSAAVHAARNCASTTPAPPNRAAFTRTTWSPGAGAGIWSPGTSTARAGAPSAPTGSRRESRPGRVSSPASCPRAT